MFLWHRLRLHNWQRKGIHLRDALKSLSNVIPPISILLFVLGFVLWGNIPSVLSDRDILNKRQETLETCCSETVDNMEAIIRDATPIVVPIQDNLRSSSIPLTFNISVTSTSATVARSWDYRSEAWVPQLRIAEGQEIIGRDPQTRCRRGCNLWSNEEQFDAGETIARSSVRARLHEQNGSWFLDVANDVESLNVYINIPSSLDSYWSFELPHVEGTYQIRFVRDDPCTEENTHDIVTPWTELHLVRPLTTNPATVEVDGIRFETLISKSRLQVPPKSETQKNEALSSVRFGLRVTNLTYEVYRFSLYNKLPQIFSTSDTMLIRGGGGSYRGPRQSSFPFVEPGDSYTYWLPSWDLVWRPNPYLNATNPNLNLNIVDEEILTIGGWERDAGRRGLGPLEPGTYQVRFVYQALTSSRSLRPLRPGDTGEDPWTGYIYGIWTGTVYLPFVELEIVAE